MALISCQNLNLSLGGRVLLDGVNLQIERGERIGLLGRNGEGKSTLLKLIAGDGPPDEGDLVISSGVKVAMLAQDVPALNTETVQTIIQSGLPAHTHGDHTVHRLCSLLELDPEQPYSALSGGQKRRVLLGRALASEPDVLLLDEPTNHLDLAGILWLESFLSRFHGSLMFVTHDRTFLQRIATRIVELDRGRLSSWECDYATFLVKKEEWLIAEEKQWAQFDKKLSQEEVWIRQGIKARRTRNEGRVRALERLRAERSQRRERIGQVRMEIQRAERSGTKVITAQHLHFTYRGPISETCDSPTEQLILHDFSTTIMRGDRIGIIGPNGCGKTTLLNLLLGRQPPQQGKVDHGTRLEVAYFDQHRHQLDETQTVVENIAHGREFVEIGEKRKHVMSYLQDFLFSPDRAHMPVQNLSGGERNRLLLARLFTIPSNVLVLDEPTNDLDTETLELLEARLLDYPGTILLVSHDRRFLDNLCTSTLVFEGGGRIGSYVGGYTDWQNTVDKNKPADTEPDVIPGSKAPGKPAKTRKLTNKEREEWQKLPTRIEALEEELSALQASMADPAFYRGDSDTVKTAVQRAHDLPLEIEQAYARWEELDERH